MEIRAEEKGAKERKEKRKADKSSAFDPKRNVRRNKGRKR